MNPEPFLEQFETFAEAPNGVEQLRAMILQLAVQGKLVPQDPSDEPASQAFDRVRRLKEQLTADGSIQSDKKFSPIVKNVPPWSIPESWVWTRLQDLFVISRGGSPRPAGDPRFFGGETPWITVGEITKDNKIHLTQTSSGLTVEGTQRSRFIELDDLLLTNSGATLGVPKISQIRGCINDGVALLKCFHEEIFKEYAYFYLRQQTKAFRNVNQGMGQPNLNTPILAGWYFPLPPLAEQKRIVAKVDQLLALCDELAARQEARRVARTQLVGATLDRLVSTRSPADLAPHVHRLRTHFDHLFDTPTTIPQLRQTILQLAVQGQLVPQDPKDEPVELLLERMSQRREESQSYGDSKRQMLVPITEGDVSTIIPSHWRWTRLNEIVTIMDSGWSPACDEEPTTDDSEWGVLKTTSVQTMSFNEGAHKRLPSNLKPRPDAEAKPGDILVTRAGPQNRVGISCLVKAVRPRLMISDKIIRFHIVEPFLFDEYICLCLNAGESQRYIEQAKSGMAASQVNISQAKFRMTPIPIPPYSEQKRIVAKVQQLLTLCEVLEHQTNDAETLSAKLLSSSISSILTNSNERRD